MSESNVSPNEAGNYVWCQGVHLKDGAVNMTQIDAALVNFLNRLGDVHPVLFGLPVVVTSGRDSLHVASSKHGIGKAVDIRVSDKRLEWRAAFLLVCGVLCDQFGLCMFDESNSPGSPHLHVEVAG